MTTALWLSCRNGRQIAGAVKAQASGTGRVELDSIYNSKLPSVTVHGEGKQDKLEGYNLFDKSLVANTSEYISETDTGIAITKSYFTNTTITPTQFLNMTGLKPGDTFYLSRKFSGEIYGASGRILFYTPEKQWYIVNGSENTAVATVPMDFDASYRTLAFYGNPKTDTPIVFSDMMFTKVPDLPYEPYCGGIPAPNPEYPIEPVFLDGASVGSRGKNLAKFEKTRKNADYGPIALPAGQYTLSVDTSGRYAAEISTFIDGQKEPATYNSKTKTFRLEKPSVVKGTFYWPASFGGLPIDARFQLEYGSTPTPYTPYYDGGTAPLPILRALPDGSVRDEDETASGTAVRKVGFMEFDGSPDEFWGQENYGMLRYKVPMFKTGTSRIYVLCNRGIFAPSGQKVGACFISNSNFYYYPDQSLDSVEKFKSWLKTHPIEIWFEAPEPITEHYDPAILRQHPGYTQLIQQGGFREAEIEAEYYKEVNG